MKQDEAVRTRPYLGAQDLIWKSLDPKNLRLVFFWVIQDIMFVAQVSVETKDNDTLTGEDKDVVGIMH